MESFSELYPFQSHYLKIDTLNYHYLDEGAGDAIVMLHGNPTWSFFYRRLILELRQDYRVIVPDHMGCGFSDKPQHYPYCLSSHIANLTHLLEHLNLTRFSLFVHDWGGAIGLGYAVQHPDAIEKMVVFNTSPTLTNRFPMRILICRIPIIGEFLVRRLNFFVRAAVRMASVKKLPAPVRSGFIMPYQTYDNRIAVHRFVQDIPLSSRHPSWALAARIQEQLGALTGKPMLICWGDRDFCFTSFFLEAWKKQYPHAIIHRFPQAGHYVLEDALDEILPLIQRFME